MHHNLVHHEVDCLYSTRGYLNKLCYPGVIMAGFKCTAFDAKPYLDCYVIIGFEHFSKYCGIITFSNNEMKKY